MTRQRGQSVDQVHKILEDRIISGFYAPGVRLSQAELSEALNTSRTPLREAFNRLQASGLIIATHNRGVEVAPVRFEHTEQLYALRLLVEPPMIAALVPMILDQDIDRMRAALDEMDEQACSSRPFQAAHLHFHEVLLSRYPDTIREAIEVAYQRIHRHQQVHFSRPHVPDDFMRLDRYFLAAIEARNPQLARQWLEFHLIDTALGLMLDIDADKRPDALHLAAIGVNIVLEPPRHSMRRPMRIRWERASAQAMPDIETTNLIHSASPAP